MSKYPEIFRYTKEHEWISQSGDTITVGITDYAQGELGDIIYLELPETGAHLVKGEPFGTIEAVKTVEEIYAPASGEVVEVNPRLADEPELLNQSPFEHGWLIKVRIGSEDELEDHMDAAAYLAMVGE